VFCKRSIEADGLGVWRSSCRQRLGVNGRADARRHSGTPSWHSTDVGDPQSCLLQNENFHQLIHKVPLLVAFLNQISSVYTEPHPPVSFSEYFAKLWKAPICFVMSVQLSVYPYWRIRFPPYGFSWFSYLRIFRKSVKRIQISLRSDKNNRYCDNISLNSSQNEKCFRWNL
jgi:hypothetical protein